MAKYVQSPWWYIGVSVLLALVLSIMPLPLELKSLRPDWVLIVIMYWAIALPHRVGIGVAWLAGILMDILLGTTLGLHALAMTIVIYITASNFQKLRNFSLWQQSLLVAVFLLLYHFVLFWINHFLTGVIFSLDYIYPAITSSLIWLWLFPVMRAYRRRFKVR